MTADLHIHTTASDGRFSPQEIFDQARRANLNYIAITDHDTIDGLHYFKSISNTELTVIPGIELNTDQPGCEVHVLGYGIDICNVQLNDELTKMTEDRVIRAQKIINKLTLLGYPVSYNRVLEIAANSRAIGRPHIAKALLEQGYFSTMDEIFNTLLDTNGPAYIPHYKLSPEGAMQLIANAGGIHVLAHPGLIGNDDIVRRLINQGLHGLEVYHPKHTEEQVKTYAEIAEKHGLLITGGSDFHGIPGRFPVQLGLFTIPSLLADTLVRRLRN